MTPEEVRALLISLRAVKKCWRCSIKRPIQEFRLPTSLYCTGCARRTYVRRYRPELAAA